MAVSAEELNPAGALHAAGAVVVNCDAVAAVVPEGHVALTLQSYKEEDDKPDKLAEVPVCAVEKLVHVPDEFNL